MKYYVLGLLCALSFQLVVAQHAEVKTRAADAGMAMIVKASYEQELAALLPYGSNSQKICDIYVEKSLANAAQKLPVSHLKKFIFNHYHSKHFQFFYSRKQAAGVLVQNIEKNAYLWSADELTSVQAKCVQLLTGIELCWKHFGELTMKADVHNVHQAVMNLAAVMGKLRNQMKRTLSPVRKAKLSDQSDETVMAEYFKQFKGLPQQAFLAKATLQEYSLLDLDPHGKLLCIELRNSVKKIVAMAAMYRRIQSKAAAREKAEYEKAAKDDPEKV